MKLILTFLFIAVSAGTAMAAGAAVDYQVNGQSYEGYFVSPAAGAPLVLLVHDWDGLTDYEIKRADMLAELGYAVFAAKSYRADADHKSWQRFVEYLQATLR